MTKKWYSLDRIKKMDTKYRVIFGERSNGKTYAVKKEVITKYATEKRKFIYVRRKHSMITRKWMIRLFEDINENDFSLNTLGGYIKYSIDNGFYFINEQGELETIGYVTSLDDCYTMKGIPFNDIDIIFYDEFIDLDPPMENEISKFMHIVSTVVRKREGVAIYMIANTVSKFSVYYELLGIDPKKLKQGFIYYIKHSLGATIAVERCKSMNVLNGEKVTNEYLGFDDNPATDMILFGEWEYDIVNTKKVDNITWNSKRLLLPFYITGNGEVYELSIHLSDNPVAFVRKINTQNGLVRKDIKYNLSVDSSVILTNANGIVPIYFKFNKLIDEQTLNYWKLFNLCFESKRIIYNSLESGSDFAKVLRGFSHV